MFGAPCYFVAENIYLPTIFIVANGDILCLVRKLRHERIHVEIALDLSNSTGRFYIRAESRRAERIF